MNSYTCVYQKTNSKKRNIIVVKCKSVRIKFSVLFLLLKSFKHF